MTYTTIPEDVPTVSIEPSYPVDTLSEWLQEQKELVGGDENEEGE